MGHYSRPDGRILIRSQLCAAIATITLLSEMTPSMAFGDERTLGCEGPETLSSASVEKLARDLPDYHPSEYFAPSNGERISFDLYDYQINHIAITIEEPSLVSFSISQFCEISGDNLAVAFSFDDRNGDYVCKYALSGNNPSDFVEPTYFEPGTYNIDVVSLGNAYFGRSVGFKYMATPVTNCYDVEENNNFDEAREIPLNTVCTGTMASMFIGSYDLDYDYDYYRFTIPVASEVWISASCPGSMGIDLCKEDETWVYDSQGRPVYGYTPEDGSTKTLHAETLQTGTYYVKLGGFDSVWGNQYQFKVTTKETPVPVAGFSDVMSDDWFASSVEFVLENHLMNGYDSNRFGPNDSFSRAQVATVIWNSTGQIAPTKNAPFSDVSSTDWFEPAVAWAYENNVIMGYNDKVFGPNDSVTREQFATILWRYCGSPESEKSLDSFPDSTSISTYAKTAMQWAVENKIINGQNGLLNPQGTTTRAMAAAILMNWKTNV